MAMAELLDTTHQEKNAEMLEQQQQQDQKNMHGSYAAEDNGYCRSDNSDMEDIGSAMSPVKLSMDSNDDSASLKKKLSVTNPNADEESTVPYSRFSNFDKMALVIQLAFTGFYSSIAGAIYYPVLTVIENQFDITEEMVNITVVVYFIFQGIAPTIMGGLADSLGRRPIVLMAVLVYCGACIGLANSHTYAQIIVLRCLQAAGISPVIAINSGICGDITTRAERGGYVGYVSGFQVIGSAFGALIGAGLSSRWGWRAVFWFLFAGSGSCFLISIVTLPETKRTIVGNASIAPKSYFNKSPLLSIPAFRRKWHLDDPDYETLEKPVPINFLAPLQIIKVKEISFLLFVAGLQFAMYTVHQTALSTALSKDYHLSVAKIGLCYLPSGICTLISVVGSGRYLNWSYRRKIAQHKEWLGIERLKLLKENCNDEAKVNSIIENDIYYTFNIFKARIQPAFITLLLSSGGFAAFGWCLTVKAHLAAVLCMSGFASVFSNCILTMSTTVIVDLYPSRGSTATGCLNLFRCSMSAILIACLSKMTQKMEYGGVFTFLGALTCCSSLLLWIPVMKGKEIAAARNKAENQLLDDAKMTKDNSSSK